MIFQHSFAGDKRGGGNVHVCENGANTQLLDYVELSQETGFTVDMGPASKDYKVHIKFVLDRLSKVDAVAAKRFAHYASLFEEEVFFADSQRLRDVSDSNEILSPTKNCKKVQFAVQREKLRALEKKKYFVDGKLWAMVSGQVKAALVLHEVIYRDQIENGNSDGVRYYNFFISSNWMNKVTSQDYYQLVKDSEFKVIKPVDASDDSKQLKNDWVSLVYIPGPRLDGTDNSVVECLYSMMINKVAICMNLYKVHDFVSTDIMPGLFLRVDRVQFSQTGDYWRKYYRPPLDISWIATTCLDKFLSETGNSSCCKNKFLTVDFLKFNCENKGFGIYFNIQSGVHKISQIFSSDIWHPKYGWLGQSSYHSEDKNEAKSISLKENASIRLNQNELIYITPKSELELYPSGEVFSTTVESGTVLKDATGNNVVLKLEHEEVADGGVYYNQKITRAVRYKVEFDKQGYLIKAEKIIPRPKF